MIPDLSPDISTESVMRGFVQPDVMVWVGSTLGCAAWLRRSRNRRDFLVRTSMDSAWSWIIGAIALGGTLPMMIRLAPAARTGQNEMGDFHAYGAVEPCHAGSS
jgi:hypothetical protein